MKLPILDIPDVVATQLCTGCGACAAIEPDRFEMHDVYDLGRRPIAKDGSGIRAGSEAFDICPGIKLKHDFDRNDPELNQDLLEDWGPVYEVWEGHAADDEIRRAGSSGGAASAIALYCLERLDMQGVLHIAAKPGNPVLNETVLSTTRAELLERTGSRYAPASPCDGLGMIESASGPCVMIGKPCDVAAAQRARKHRPILDDNLGAVIAFFCAGTPSYKGTVELLETVGCDDPTKVESLRYRGMGWPGKWTAKFRNSKDKTITEQLTYEKSWDFLQRHRQWRCYICPDHTGEFADIAVGDPWSREPQEGEAGSSLIVVRTARGREILQGAAQAGYITLEKSDPDLLPASQPNLLATRGAVWGRLQALSIAGVPTPSFTGFQGYTQWRALPHKDKLRSTLGTLRRIARKGLKRRIEPIPWNGKQPPTTEKSK